MPANPIICFPFTAAAAAAVAAELLLLLLLLQQLQRLQAVGRLWPYIGVSDLGRPSASGPASSALCAALASPSPEIAAQVGAAAGSSSRFLAPTPTGSLRVCARLIWGANRRPGHVPRQQQRSCPAVTRLNSARVARRDTETDRKAHVAVASRPKVSPKSRHLLSEAQRRRPSAPCSPRGSSVAPESRRHARSNLPLGPSAPDASQAHSPSALPSAWL